MAEGEKARIIREYAEQEQIDLDQSCAFSDSTSDIPMLEVTGKPVATNPSRRLRRIAMKKNWPIVELKESKGKFPPFLQTAAGMGIQTPVL